MRHVHVGVYAEGQDWIGESTRLHSLSQLPYHHRMCWLYCKTYSTWQLSTSLIVCTHVLRCALIGINLSDTLFSARTIIAHVQIMHVKNYYVFVYYI